MPPLSAIAAISLGFALGLAHATDADHVVAVSTMLDARDGAATFSERLLARLRSAANIGAFWGLGHTLTILLLGGAIVVFRLALPETLATALELCVAVMLVVLGVASFRAGLRAGATHLAKPGPPKSGVVTRLRSLGVGAVHGVAGSAAVALAVLARTEDPAEGGLYLACFGVGALAGMVLLSLVMALPFALAHRLDGLTHRIRAAAGVVSIGLGVFMFLELTFFGAHALASVAAP